ncbi:MAG TPA: serine/threonine-protein kinase [Polyangiaceae bacterium]|nr:serine/threonine-protein kinase [Polyangiaceae bacterium]
MQRPRAALSPAHRLVPMSSGGFSVSERALARVGSAVGKYQLTCLLGVGGTAVVYAATHRNGHRVAIKFLLEHLADDPEFCRSFRREAQVVNQVGHPGAVPVLDDDVDERGCPFLIMPLLEGETVRARWERDGKRMAVGAAGQLMSDVLDVLTCAHANGIVHRDIKPDNLFITAAGRVHVLDFGIARRAEEDGGTVSAQVIGTPAFMAPEQAIGDPNAVGPHSDIWAVGATIFSLLSGEFVHRTDGSRGQLAAAATRHARSLAEANPELPPAVVQFVDKALAFEPSDRWRSAREMRDAMNRCLRRRF